MTEYLELVLLVAFVVSATALLIAGVVELTLHLVSAPLPRAMRMRRTSTRTDADEASSVEKEVGT